ncbi:MAG: hypothetical protein AAFQ18_04325 [Pseudomonadota bacterium]
MTDRPFPFAAPFSHAGAARSIGPAISDALSLAGAGHFRARIVAVGPIQETKT